MNSVCKVLLFSHTHTQESKRVKITQIFTLLLFRSFLAHAGL